MTFCLPLKIILYFSIIEVQRNKKEIKNFYAILKQNPLKSDIFNRKNILPLMLSTELDDNLELGLKVWLIFVLLMK